jgi:hypothetical protein
MKKSHAMRALKERKGCSTSSDLFANREPIVPSNLGSEGNTVESN